MTKRANIHCGTYILKLEYLLEHTKGSRILQPRQGAAHRITKHRNIGVASGLLRNAIIELILKSVSRWQSKEIDSSDKKLYLFNMLLSKDLKKGNEVYGLTKFARKERCLMNFTPFLKTY